MKLLTKTNLYWLLMGPVLALVIAWPASMVYEFLTPGKVDAFADIIALYPLGLFLSLLTPWGWLMMGGLWMMDSPKHRLGIFCTLFGAFLLGVFWPVWGTFLSQ